MITIIVLLAYNEAKKSITSVARIRREDNRTTTFRVIIQININYIIQKSSYQKSKHPHILNERTDFLIMIIEILLHILNRT